MSDSTDDPHDLSVVASAYLDGEATPDERAWIESNPAALAEVDRLRELRSVLGATVEPAPVSVREAHLAAALDVWDRMPETERSGASTPAAGVEAAAAAAVSTPPPTSLTARRERRSAWETPKWLLGAAAGLVVLAGAGLIVRSAVDRTDDDDAGDANETAAVEPASEPDALELDVGREFIDENTGDEPPAEVDSDNVASAGDIAQVPAEEPAAEADDGGEGDDAGAVVEEESADVAAEAEPAEGAEQAEPPPDIDIVELLTARDLADFGAFAAYAVDFAVPATTLPPSGCQLQLGIERLAEPAIYRGEQVAIGIDFDNMQVVAFLPAECALVDSVPLPSEDEFDARRGTNPVVDDGTPDE